MKKVVAGLIATLLPVAVYASGPGGDPGATGHFSESLYASESSGDLTTYVYLNRYEYSVGYNWGFVEGHVDGTYFHCQLLSDEDLLAVDKDAETAVIQVGSEDVEYCWSSWLPAPITFDCKASGYMGSKGVSNYETYYFDGFEYKAHTKYADNAVDCVVFIGDDIVLNASSGIVWDGNAHVEKYIQPNQEQED